ncbi:MAG: TRAM domain-containing protein [Candidatus ainarchaeum sp.]|nr:TRAM domain-containing protein [Candidatus ainarchaeum sp.]
MEETPTKRRFEAPKPVTAGDVREVVIENLSGQGDGIAKIDEFVVFVKGVKKGERCRIRIVDVKRTYAIGEKTGPAGKKETTEEMEDETEPFRDGPTG